MRKTMLKSMIKTWYVLAHLQRTSGAKYRQKRVKSEERLNIQLKHKNLKRTDNIKMGNIKMGNPWGFNRKESNKTNKS